MERELQEKLDREVDITTWRDLRSHAARDVLFLVAAGLTLVEAGKALAMDQAELVAGYIEGGQLTRPTGTQMAEFEKDLGKTFECLIVSPFVLAREVQVETN